LQEEDIRVGNDGDNNNRVSTLTLPLVIGLIALVILGCAAAGAIIAVVSSTSPLPTEAAPATIEFAFEAESEPTSPTVIVQPTLANPQPGDRSAGDPYIPELGNGGYDVQHYKIQLALDPEINFVEGATTIGARSTIDGLSQISLDFVGYQVNLVTIDGITTDFTREGSKLVIDLPHLVPSGDPFSIVVTYQGAPLEESSPYVGFAEHLGLHYPDGDSVFAVAEPDGARYWFPANDHPRDKATYRFEIVVPAGLTAVANGQLLETRTSALPNGDLGELFIWEHNYPMASYLALVAVGDYERIDDRSPGGIPLRHYVFPELEEESRIATSTSAEAIDWMSDLFGSYPFETFGFVTVAMPGASMETQTMVLLSDSMIGPRTAVHELAHMWFGNWVSLDSWAEMWRNEGFATYITMMWVTRDDPEELELQIAGMKSAAEENGRQYALNNPPAQALFDFNVYFEGAAMVHELRQEMGDEAFFEGLRNYFDTYGGGTASDAQFQAIMEEAAGFSLAPFFAQWFPSG
jgi:aminopeptidase N